MLAALLLLSLAQASGEYECMLAGEVLAFGAPPTAGSQVVGLSYRFLALDGSSRCPQEDLTVQAHVGKGVDPSTLAVGEVALLRHHHSDHATPEGMSSSDHWMLVGEQDPSLERGACAVKAELQELLDSAALPLARVVPEGPVAGLGCPMPGLPMKARLVPVAGVELAQLVSGRSVWLERGTGERAWSVRLAEE